MRACAERSQRSNEGMDPHIEKRNACRRYRHNPSRYGEWKLLLND